MTAHDASPGLPALGPNFPDMSASDFSTHVSSLYAESRREAKARKPRVAKIRVRVARPAKRRPVTPGALALTLGSVTHELAFHGAPKARRVTRPALVAAALALRCEERLVEGALTTRYSVTVTDLFDAPEASRRD